jgi:hypothetical protein
VLPIPGLEIKSSIGTKLSWYGNTSFTPIYYLNGSTSNPITTYYQESDQVWIFDWRNTASYTRV